ncbi:hypothetical protein BKG69_06100 [Mycobacteroides chelonae]|uniref:hypothetical protein n=1 Tax=Mycobacteroides chelonae TaxID=1774 RepID=UPI0008A999E2|nr:hypothetical protein [Mycobacteroides chelonae]OHT80479.1 hypothetical protein BKG69_06100 [Mycobacteroides chelonae]
MNTKPIPDQAGIPVPTHAVEVDDWESGGRTIYGPTYEVGDVRLGTACAQRPDGTTGDAEVFVDRRVPSGWRDTGIVLNPADAEQLARNLAEAAAVVRAWSPR